MALFGIKMKKKRAVAYGSYHIYSDDEHSFHKRVKNKESIGIARAIFSGLSLSFGVIMCYIAMHYVPAYVQTHKIISSTNIDTSPKRLENKGPIRKIFGPYIDAFSLQRTYLRKDQEIQAQFILPKGATLDLSISQCRRMFAIEILKCDVVMQHDVKVSNELIGTKAFQFPGKGFYHFNHKVTFANNTPADYKVVWTRF